MNPVLVGCQGHILGPRGPIRDPTGRVERLLGMTGAPAIAIGHDMAGDREEPATKAVVPFSRPELAKLSQGVGKDLTDLHPRRPASHRAGCNRSGLTHRHSGSKKSGPKAAGSRWAAASEHVLTFGQREPVSGH